MKKILIFAIIISALAAFTCCNGRDEAVTLERAEAFLPAQPDSADSCLCSITEPQKLNESQSALYGLLRTYTDNRLQKGVKSDSLIRGSYEHYHEASRAGQTSDKELLRRYAQSCYYMALFYYSCDSIKQCEELFNQAAKYSERCEDWHTCYLAHTLLGVINWGTPQYSTEQSLKALEFYRKINDDVSNEVLILGKIAASYLPLEKPDSALVCYMEAYKLAEEHHLQEYQNQMCMGLASTYRYVGEYEKALNYAKRGIKTANEGVIESSLLNLAACYYACDSLDNAKEILKSFSPDLNEIRKYLIFHDLSQIAIKQRHFDSLFIYVDSAYTCLEKRYLKMEHVKDEYYQENLAKELEKERLQHQAKLNKWVAAFIISVLALIALIIYNVLRKRIAAERQRRLGHLLSQRNEHLQHLLAQEKQERVIADQEREITCQRKIITQKAITMSVIRKHLMERLNYEVTQVISSGEDDMVGMTEVMWQELEQVLNETDNNFVQDLRKGYPDFKEEDIQLCMLVRLKVSNNVLAHIYHIGVPAVKKRKLNLKMKGFEITDPAIHLEDIIDKL